MIRHHSNFPLNAWFTMHPSEVVWRYRHAPTYSSEIDDIWVIKFPGGWRIELNSHITADTDTLQEAKDICPMLVRMHGRTAIQISEQ
jgi:hypothetical protein